MKATPTIGLLCLGLITGAGSEVLLDQPHDYLDGFTSYGSGARFADDITIAKPTLIERITFEGIVSWPDPPDEYNLDIYNNNPKGGPVPRRKSGSPRRPRRQCGSAASG